MKFSTILGGFYCLLQSTKEMAFLSYSRITIYVLIDMGL